MLRSRVRRRTIIPAVTTQKMQTKDFEFVKGYNSNLSNDAVPTDKLRYITDAREIEIGKWHTRKGNELLSTPIGEAVNVQQTSTTGASNQSFSTTTHIAHPLVAAADGRLTGLEARIKNPGTATGTVVLALFTNVSASPGRELARTTIAASSITSSYQYLLGRFMSCPDITTGDTYWVVLSVQEGGSGSYQVSSTTTVTTAKTSTNSGDTWSSSSFGCNVKLSSATASAVKGCIRLKRPNGARYTFMAHGSNLYSINEVTKVATSVDSGIDANSQIVRFAFVNDTLYYVTGTQKPRKYDFTTASEVTGAPEAAHDLIEFKGLLVYASASDTTKFYCTNFAAYDTFTSTDFFHVPAPKTADPIVGFAKLSGVLYVITRNNKYAVYGTSTANFRIDTAIGEKGTFNEESFVYDNDYIYLASDDGIYSFNGAQEKNISEDILKDWIVLRKKGNTKLQAHNNRVYVWHTPNESAQNTKCFVYHTLYNIWESLDLGTYVGASSARNAADNSFIQGSNRVGMLMYGEADTNDYNNLGEPLLWELRTNYNHYEAPAQLKRAPYFRPHLDAESGNYNVDVGFALDYAEPTSWTDIALQQSGVRFDTGAEFDDGEVFGSETQVNPLDSAPVVPGEWLRLQVRYKHYAARQPISFDGHVLTIETQRII